MHPHARYSHPMLYGAVLLTVVVVFLLGAASRQFSIAEPVRASSLSHVTAGAAQRSPTQMASGGAVTWSTFGSGGGAVTTGELSLAAVIGQWSVTSEGSASGLQSGLLAGVAPTQGAPGFKLYLPAVQSSQ